MYEDDKLLSEFDWPKKPRQPWKPKLPTLRLVPWLRKTVKILLYAVVFFVSLFVIFYVNSSLSDKKDSLSWINKIPIIGQIKSLAEYTSTPLQGEERGRVNILFLGVGGEGHDGAQLTDTMMVFSVDTKNNKVAMLSIPRDLAVPMDNLGWRKINNVNAYAEMASPGTGGAAASQAVSNILNTPIDYYVKVDFAGFTKIIDYFGGIEVDVERTFDDYTYPAEGREDDPVYVNRFEHLHIEQGRQKMDGTLALKYARSRHAYGPEGTDFARAARQQKVIQAVKKKALSAGTLTNPALIANIVGELEKNISTDMKVWEMAKLWQMTKDIDDTNIITKVLSNQPEGLLMDTTGQDGAYLLMPRAGNFSEVEYLFKNIFEQGPAEKREEISSENAKVKILNGTWISGLAGKIAADLGQYDFRIIGIGNCSRQDFERSVIYDLTFGAKKKSLEFLQEQTGANVTFTLPDWLKSDLASDATTSTNGQPDLVLILGQDMNKNYEID